MLKFRKKYLLLFLQFCIFFFFLSNDIYSQKVIVLKKTNSVYKLKCKVNGIPMEFIFDTGASDVTISLTEANFLIKQGLLNKEDIKESVKYKIANGEIEEGTKINLKKIVIEGYILNNIEASIVHNSKAPLLFGLNGITKLGKIVIENDSIVIYLDSRLKTENNTPVKNSQKETAFQPSGSKVRIGNMEIMNIDLGKMKWPDAKRACTDLGNDWRLPTKDELLLMYKYKPLSGVFAETKYWSSDEENTEMTWYCDFSNGTENYDSKFIECETRAVRTFHEATIKKSSSTIKIDKLEIMSKDLTAVMNWQEAKSACKKLGKGWRLPTKAELMILYKNKDKIGGFTDSFYWSSSEIDESFAYTQGFYSGTYSEVLKTFPAYVRPVRNY